ncbi:MAG: hypothetical protein KDD66_13870 [Bdellovibrionales bacterium]|nr:hypothetical protein [Bdellovibrionales bacterium]
MPKKKRPRRKKKKPQKQRAAAKPKRQKQKPVPARIKLDVPSHEENRYFTLVLYAPAVIGGLISLTGEPKDLLLFALLLSALLSSAVYGGLFRQLLKLAPLREYHSILDLKRSIDQGSVHQGHERMLVKLKAIAHALVLASLIVVFFFFSVSPQATAVLFCVCAVIVTAKLLPLETPSQILLHVCSMLATMSASAVLGVFTQTKIINSAVAIIGFVPGSILAASFVALHAAVFESQRWRRNRAVTTRKGATVQRPAALAMLYSTLFFVGPMSVFVLATAGKLPAAFMAAGVILMAAPTLATAFQTGSLSNAEVYARTLWQALMMTVVISVAAAIAAI